MLFDKRYHIARFPAAETLEDASLGIHVERRSLLLMKWAQAKVVAASVTQLHILANNVDYIRL